MGDLVLPIPRIPAMSTAAINRVREIEAILLTRPQLEIDMHHVLHGGLYARTALLPAGYQMTGALIKIPTTLTIRGDVLVCLGAETVRITGYAVMPASAGRKQAFHAFVDTHITMSFPTKARTVAEAEREFTDDADRLAPGRAVTIITGE